MWIGFSVPDHVGFPWNNSLRFSSNIYNRKFLPCLLTARRLGLLSSSVIKGTRRLGSVELVLKSILKTVCYKMHIFYGKKDVLKVEYIDPHKHASKLRGFLCTSSTKTLALGHLWESNL